MALGSLVIELSTNVARLQSDFGKAATLAQRASDQMSSAFNNVQRAFSAIGTGLSIGALTAFVKSGIDAADNLNKLSQKVGVSVESLSALQYAAKLADVSNEQLSTGLAKLARNAVDAQLGTGEAAEGFKALGVSVADASGRMKTTESILLAVAERFASMEDSAEKTAIAMKLFGKSGADLIPFLNQGAVGIEELRKEAERLGIVIGSQTAKAAEEFNDNMTRLTRSTDALKFSIAENLLPFLAKLTDELVKASKAGDGTISTLNAMATLATGKFGDTTAEQLRNIDKALSDLDKTRKLFRGAAITETLLGVRESNLLQLQRLVQARAKQEQTDADLKAIKNLPFQDDTPVGSGNVIRLKSPPTGGRGSGGESPFQRAVKSLEDQSRKMKELTIFEETLAQIEAGRYGKLLPAQRDQLLNLAAAADLVKEDVRVQREAEAATEAFFKAEQDRIRAQDERLTRIAESALDNVDATRAWRRSVDELAEAYQRGLLSAEEFNKAAMNPRLRSLLEPVKTDFDILNEALKEGDISLEKYLEVVKRLREEQGKLVEQGKDLGRGLFQPLSSAFEDAVVNGKKLSDVLRSLEKDLLAIGTRTLVTEPLGKWFAEKITGLGGGQGLSGMFGQASNLLGGMFGLGGGGGGFGSMAVSGGLSVFDSLSDGSEFVPRTGPYLLHKGEAVIPAGQNGGNVQVYMTVNTPDANSFRRNQHQIAADMSDAANMASRRFR